MSDIISAAQSLIATFSAPPQAHSVFVRTEIDPDTQEFKRKICVSIHPRFKGNLTVPEKHLGFTVERVEWPKELK